MQNEYMENKSKCGSMYGGGFMHSAISRKASNSCEAMCVEEMYPDAFFISTEREQRQQRSKTVRQIMHDDYMKKYGHGTP